MKKKKFLNLYLNFLYKIKKNYLFDILFLITLGVLSSFSLPPYNFFWINFFTFSLLFIFLFKKFDYAKNKKYFFFYGWLFGFGYFISNLYWISISLTFDKNFSFLIPITIILIPTFLALFYGFISFLFFIFKTKKILSDFFLFSLLFATIEFLRGNILTGFPWNFIVYSLSDIVEYLSILSFLGTYSLNLITISIFIAPSILLLTKSKINILVSIFFLILPIIFLIFGSHYKKNFVGTEYEKNDIIIRAVGSNIDLDRFYLTNQTEKALNELIEISQPDPNKKIFFIWPEGIIPNTYQNNLSLYKDIFAKHFNENHYIGIGINHKQNNNEQLKYFNSFSIYDYELNLVNSYNKIKLVPFGEFLPLESLLSKLGLKSITNNYQSYSKGDIRQTINIKIKQNSLKVLPLICYEIIYSGAISTSNNFDLIVNISEDGWFGKSIGPKQHFVHSLFRAIESGKYVIRSSNNGIAAAINPIGIVEKEVPFGKNGYIDLLHIKNVKPTIFSIYGNKIFWLFILLYIFLVISFNKMRNE